MRVSQTVLPFKPETTDDTLTAHAGLALMGEYLGALGFGALVNDHLPAPRSHKGYAPGMYVESLVLMLHGGGRTLEDLRMLRSDTGLLRLLQMPCVPSSDAVGDWLRRVGSESMDGLQRVNRTVLRRLLRREECKDYTLDIDATEIVAEKYAAQFTYKGNQGYMPMVGHLAENGLVVGQEFRAGNVAPAARNLEFMQACAAHMPKGKRIAAVRADSAAYQADIFNWCEEVDIRFAIGASQDVAVKAAIRAIAPSAWRKFNDEEIAETVHGMNAGKAAFRLIVIRRPQQGDLLKETEPYFYHAIASNHPESMDAASVLRWYRQRGDKSENRIKELKNGFHMDTMPCGTFTANAAFFAIGVLAYDLYIGFRAAAPGNGFARAQVQTVRWQLYQIAGKNVSHGRELVLKISHAAHAMFDVIRSHCATLLHEARWEPETT